jgi:hypothetical protein
VVTIVAIASIGEAKLQLVDAGQAHINGERRLTTVHDRAVPQQLPITQHLKLHAARSALLLLIHPNASDEAQGFASHIEHERAIGMAAHAPRILHAPNGHHMAIKRKPGPRLAQLLLCARQVQRIHPHCVRC